MGREDEDGYCCLDDIEGRGGRWESILWSGIEHERLQNPNNCFFWFAMDPFERPSPALRTQARHTSTTQDVNVGGYDWASTWDGVSIRHGRARSDSLDRPKDAITTSQSLALEQRSGGESGKVP
jgi:hypothetical protein